MSELKKFEPHPIVRWLYDRVFSNMEIDETWAESVRDADSRGTVVYVLRNLSFVDFFALDYLTKRLELPEVRFANDLGLSVFEPFGKGWKRALERRTEDDHALELRRALEQDASAVLFLKRPPTPGQTRAQSEGDKLLSTVLDVQRANMQHPILLVPEVFVWSRYPDLAKHDAVDMLFGPREWPGKMRTLAQFVMNYRHVTMRAGDPIDLAQFLEREGKDTPTDVLVRRLTYALLRRLERERHAILGPAKKPEDRVREEIIRSPKLRKVIADMAGEGDAERRALTERADKMLRELEATQDVNSMKVMEIAFNNTIKRMYTAFEIDNEGLERIRKVAREGSLVLLPSHKSHVDYIILTWLFYYGKMPPPLIAAGDNLSFFPLGPLLRRAGAFFIRRSFKGDRLYGAVVDAYVRRLIKDGSPIEFFLEGGRSRTGKLLSPKLGLLGMVIDAAQGREDKVFFCPISIGYERTVEEEEYVREIEGGEKKKEDVSALVSTLEVAMKRYGRLNVQFGEPITIAELASEMGIASSTEHGTRGVDVAALPPAKRRALITRLSHRVMNEINRVTAISAASLVATAILVHPHRGISHVDMVERAVALASMLKDLGARFLPTLESPNEPGGIRKSALTEAAESLVRDGRILAHHPGGAGAAVGGNAKKRPKIGRNAKIPISDETIYTVEPEGRIALDLTKNLLVHFFLERALVASSLVPQLAHGPMNIAMLKERVLYLSRLFKYEFSFRADASFERIFEETLAALEGRREITREGDRISAGKNEADLRLYAAVFLNFIEAYRVASRSLTELLKGALAEKELEKRALDVGERMYHADEILRREAVSRPLLTNAYLAFKDQGYLAREKGRLVLPETYASEATAKTIEARIASYVSRG